jgi:hypothetical protein
MHPCTYVHVYVGRVVAGRLHGALATTKTIASLAIGKPAAKLAQICKLELQEP